MLLIFGIKRLNRRLATMLAICGQCTTPAAQVIVKRSTWFSLFFIPIIPLGTKYTSTCTLCGVSVKVDKDQALQMVAAAQQVSAPSPDLRVPQSESMVPPPSASPLEP